MKRNMDRDNPSRHTRSITRYVERSRRGDRAGYDEIVRRFQDMALAYCCSLIGDRQSGEDAAQEAFVEAYLHLDNLAQPAAFPGWFRTILYRQCHRIMRRKHVGTVPLATCDLLIDSASGGLANAMAPHHAVEAGETRMELTDAISRLAEPERLVVNLYYMSDHSVAEVASFLSLPTNTVKKRLQSARRKLKERMSKFMPEQLEMSKPEKDAAFAKRVDEMLTAAVEGRVDTVRSLLKIDPAYARVTDANYATPLHNVVQSGNVEIAQELIDAGADINAKYNRTGHTPLSWAVTWGESSFGVADVLVRGGAVLDLWCAAGLGRFDIVKSFWDVDGVLVDQPSLTGSSRYDADGNALPRPPESPVEMVSDALYIASRNGHIDIARWLLDHGADVHFKAFAGGTPLHWAYFSGVRELIDLLLAHGADPEARDDFNDATPPDFGLIMVSEMGTPDRVRRLLDDGLATANTPSAKTTPLHAAAYYGHVEIAQLLLDRGANPKATNVDGKTPLDVARERGHTRLADLLAAH